MDADQARIVNQQGWDQRVAEGDIWTVPVSADEIERARCGIWSVVLTPTKATPRAWFGRLVGEDILCLASGGFRAGSKSGCP